MALGRRKGRSLRSPTLKPRRENRRKPAVHGASDGWEMWGWETDWSDKGIRMIGPNQSITARIIDKTDQNLGTYSWPMDRSGVTGDSPFSGTHCRAVGLRKSPKLGAP